ncbi:MAG TPA: ABC transporter permease [Candidatus Angelobacter sp.]|jgi:putative ABC transport system permease protein|nr:ABC transporter permease [Candidatus Angelobacter sp.]
MSLRDLVFASRVLRKSPVFTLTAALTIALGVGASTAIFSVTNAVLLQPLPFKDPGRLVIVASDLRKRNVRDFPLSDSNYIDLREGSRKAFQDMAGVFTFPNLLPMADGTPEQVQVAVVTTNFFRLMGNGVFRGRDFTDDDGLPQPQPPAVAGAAQPVAPAAPAPPRLPAMAILSYEYFQRRFGGDTSIFGRPMVTSGPFTPVVIGVLPPNFHLYFPPSANTEAAPDIWIANRLAYDTANRNQVSIQAVARLKEGVSLETAQTAADAVAAEGRKNFPIENTAGYYLRVEPMQQHMTAEVRPAIWSLMGAVIFLLLIACSNVANLLLVRASLRERELAVRAALGGSRWRLVRQILMEALLVAGLGGLAGLGLAWLGIHELRVIAPANLPRLESIRIDVWVLSFTVVASFASAVIFGIMPAWRTSRPDLMNALRGSRSPALAGGRLLRNLVVVFEVALSFVLLIGSGLMVRSFMELQRINPGFDPRGLLTFQILGNFGNKQEQRAVVVRQIQEQLRAISGVQSVTASFPFPLAGGFSPIRWGTEEALTDNTKFKAVDFQIVLPGYFETMRTPLLAGRTFTEGDNAPGPGHNVVVIDQFLADKAFPRQSAIGKRILIRVRTPEPEWVEVIGVVAHQRDVSLIEPGREQVYFTDAFLNSGAVAQWAVRSANDSAVYGAEVRAVIKRLDPKFLVARMEPVDTLVREAQAGTRFSLLLIGIFAVIAALLAGVGLYGVLSTAVRQRTAEIGLRMALGAGPGKIFKLIVGHGMFLSIIGIALGLAVAYALTRVMTSMLVGVKATDAATFITTAIAFLLIATMASWLPARRAAGLDPTVALREE